MGKKVLTLANVLVILYFLASHYNIAHKWEWLTLAAIILGVVLVIWSAPKKSDGVR